MNFIDYAQTVSKKLVAQKNQTSELVVSGAMSNLESYREQVGFIKGISLALGVLQQVHDDWMNTGMKPSAIREEDVL